MNLQFSVLNFQSSLNDSMFGNWTSENPMKIAKLEIEN